MADEKVIELLQQMLMQMEAQQQAVVRLTAALDKYLGDPVKIDANKSPVSFTEGSAVSVNNKPTVAAEQAGAWNVGVSNTPGVTLARQKWAFMVLIGPNATPGTPEVKKFIDDCNKFGSEGWEIINVTGYPTLVASFKRPL
jgi:hypothetical protein